MIKTKYLVFLVNEEGAQAADPCLFMPNDSLERAMRAAAKRGFRKFNLVERMSSLCDRSDRHLRAVIEGTPATPEEDARVACALRREIGRRKENS